MSKETNPKPMVHDPCLDEEPTSKPVEIDSLVNQAYLDNLPMVRRAIEERRREDEAARRKLSGLIIK